MARIRSILPPIFTDEAWASVAADRRWLGLGLLTEADDHGVFEWKPLQIKMRIFPADAVDVAAMLADLQSANIVMKFEFDGKQYGALRNFCKFQRPRKPKTWFPITEEVARFVRKDAAVPQKSELDEDEADPVPPKSENPPQREEVICMREEVIGSKNKNSRACSHSNSNSKPTVAAIAEEFWKAYPKRSGTNPKADALLAFSRLTEEGVDPHLIVSAAKAYAVAQADLIGTQYIPFASTWLARREFDDYAGLAAPAPSEKPFHLIGEDLRLAAWDAHSRATRGRPYPRDAQNGWRFPTEWPPGHDGPARCHA